VVAGGAGALDEEAAPLPGRVRVTPASAQSLMAAPPACAISEAVQAFSTHETRLSTKEVALQIQAMSVNPQLVVPKAPVAQVIAQLGRALN